MLALIVAGVATGTVLLLIKLSEPAPSGTIAIPGTTASRVATSIPAKTTLSSRPVLTATSSSPHTTAASTKPRTKPPRSSPPATRSAQAPTADFAAIYKRQQSGVVRIETISCTHSGVGTGFLLSPTLVATVDHVVAQSAVVNLITATGNTTGTVIGSDPARDLALVRADQPLAGYNFHFATAAPGVGDLVAAIGFPIGDPITMTRGGVSGLDRIITVDGTTLTGLVETDTPINPGNSGGPLISADGSVLGLVEARRTDANGIGYAIPAGQASLADSTWAATPVPQPPADCQNPLGPSQQEQPVAPGPGTGSAPDARMAGIVDSLNTYFGGIDSGDYAAAYSVQGPSQRSSAGVEGFASGLLTSYDSNIKLLGARSTSATSIDVDLSFTSLQTAAYGPDGDTCDNWTLTFTMIQASNGTWLMDGVQPYHGRTHTTC